VLYEEYILAKLDPASCFWVEPAKVGHNKQYFNGALEA